jgi:divalent metal cation (Fe/Co/Zn/Cd) transporter
MDGIEPELVDRARHALEHTPGVVAVPSLRLRWVGHRLQGDATLQIADVATSEGDRIAHSAQHELAHALPNLDEMVLRTTASVSASAPHSH